MRSELSPRWRFLAAVIIGLALILGLGFCVMPDRVISSFFYRPDGGFFLADWWGFRALHWLATAGARVFGLGLLIISIISLVLRRKVFAITGKGWLFLSVALLLVPALAVNVGFKDHWGRARPRETAPFGGTMPLTPALSPQPVMHSNGSFPAGDPSFGFFLAAFAYVVPLRKSREVFWTGIAAGCLTGLARIAMGAHFFSDVVYAGVIVMTLTAILHGLFFNFRLTFDYAALWFFRKKAADFQKPSAFE